jgi:thiol-disulfide isomerase/thioredoxin
LHAQALGEDLAGLHLNHGSRPIETSVGTDVQLKNLLSAPGIVVVNYYSDLDSPCRLMYPTMKKLCVSYPTVTFLKVDLESSKVSADDIQNIPTFRFYKNERLVHELVHEDGKSMTEDSIAERIESILNMPQTRSKGLSRASSNSNANIEYRDKKRIALVVGNSNYQGSPKLEEQPHNDAKAIAELLKGHGFDLYQDGPLLDLTHKQFDDAVFEFATQVKKDSIVVFFFAGHGQAVGQTSYLIPIDDKKGWTEADLKDKGISVEWIVDKLEERGPFGCFLFLDACRLYPITPTSVTRGAASSSGLAACTSLGSSIMYACGVGKTASNTTDGAHSQNGLFTTHLLEHLTEQKDVTLIINLVRKGVDMATNGKQKSYVDSNMYEPIILCPRPL